MKITRQDIAPSAHKLPVDLLMLLKERSFPIEFEEDVWRLSCDPFATYANLRVLRWDIEIAPGESLTAENNRKLLVGAKEALLVDMSCRNHGGSDITTRVTLRRIVRVVSWMRLHNIESFEHMSSSELHALLSDMSGELRDSHNPSKQLQPYISLFERLRARQDLNHPVPRDLKIRRVEAYAGRYTHGSNKELFPPDDLLIALLSKASFFLEPWVDGLLELREEYISQLGAVSSMTETSALWKRLVLQRPELMSVARSIAGLDLTTRRSGSTMFVQLYNACFVVIGGFTGMRVSEILNLEIGCISSVTHSDGATYNYVRGVRNKNRGGFTVGMWVAPSKVVRAIQLLERLRKPLNFERSNKLAVAYSVKGIWPLAKKSNVQSIHVGGMIARINAMAALGPSKVNWHFTMHQLRRGFCRYVVLRDKRGLLALAEQYGHVHWATTDSGYVGTDYEIDNLLEEEDVNDLVRSLSVALSADRPSGPGVSRLIKELESQQFLGRIATLDTASALLAAGVILVPCDWGYCVYRPELSACQGSDFAPNPLGRSPEVCAGCNNFSLDERHLFWWTERVSKLKEFVVLKNIPWQSRMIAKKRLDVGSNIIRMLHERGAS